MFLKIITGLIGLGIVVFVHELGHFIAAKLAGIEVEVFSLGWGRKILSFTKNGTEYRISLFPIGGFCKMKGDEAVKRAWENKEKKFQHEKGSFFSASPIQRIFVAVSGPFMNVFFSVVILTIIWFAGFSVPTFGNKLILESDYPLTISDSYPASEAGLQTGDRIVEINGKKIEYYKDIQTIIATSPEEKLFCTVIRGNTKKNIVLIPELDPDSGAGRIGVYAWVDPVIETVRKDSSAYIAGIESGDVLTSVSGVPVNHTLDFISAFMSKPQAVDITVYRENRSVHLKLFPHYDDNGNPEIGVSFKPIIYKTPKLNIFSAFVKGITETGNTIGLTFKSLGLLFRGINLSNAVSGPIRITYYMGEIASSGFKLGIGQGLISLFNFLSFISIALFVMQLIPIPALDGGQILLFIIEFLTRRPIRPRLFFRYQIIGFSLIFMLLIFATMNDLVFLFKQ
jgi:regulator of sigma E protease